MSDFIAHMLTMCNAELPDSERVLVAVDSLAQIRGPESATTEMVAALMDDQCSDSWDYERTLTALRAAQEKGHAGYAEPTDTSNEPGP